MQVTDEPRDGIRPSKATWSELGLYISYLILIPVGVLLHIGDADLPDQGGSLVQLGWVLGFAVTTAHLVLRTRHWGASAKRISSIAAEGGDSQSLKSALRLYRRGGYLWFAELIVGNWFLNPIDGALNWIQVLGATLVLIGFAGFLTRLIFFDLFVRDAIKHLLRSTQSHYWPYLTAASFVAFPTGIGLVFAPGSVSESASVVLVLGGIPAWLAVNYFRYWRHA